MAVQHPDMKLIKHEFMAYRNGIVADALRKAGQPYSIIFGLQLPQLSQIAAGLDHTMELGRALWADRNVRESRLLAAWVFPTDQLEEEEAFAMATDARTREEADILAFRLLRRLPYAATLATRLLSSEGSPSSTGASTSLSRYAGEALTRNLS